MKPAPCKCPACGEFFDAATNINDRADPEPGDLSLCVHCAHVGKFDERGVVVSLDPGEFDALPEDQRAQINRVAALILMRRAIHEGTYSWKP